MPTSPASFVTTRFIAVATEIANVLDFTSRIVDDRISLAQPLFAIEQLYWDLRFYAATAGLDGVPVVEAATVVRDELTTAVDAHDHDGNLNPWVRCRDRVREQVDRLRSMMPVDPVSKVVVSEAAPAPPASTPQTPHTGDKGKEGGNVRTDPATAEEVAKTLDAIGRRCLKAMRSVHPDVLTAETVVEEIRDSQGANVTIYQVRRRLDRFKVLHLTHPGRGRGTPLAPLGIKVADLL